nr:CDP-glycerol glycerophosphotransferase family protein [Treponema bryantii]
MLYTVRILLSIYKIFRIHPKQCFFMSYEGSQYSCNPRAIYEYMDKNFEGFVFIWAATENVNVKSASEKNKLKIVKPNTFASFFYIITSKYVFTNIQLSTYIPKKKDSIWVNTWHGGGAFKKVEYPSINLYAIITKKLQCKQTDFYISSSQIFTEVMSASTNIPKSKFLKIGMPRNDIFFVSNSETDEIKKSVRRKYGIPESNFIVIYAPTYRGDAHAGQFNMELDILRVIDVMKIKYRKEISFLVRSHHTVNSNFEISDNFIDVTDYPDMQDLLITADCLITDYSSCIWDFALTKKPGFLFVPDLQEYIEKRGLYMDISDMPYPYAENNTDLINLISNYNIDFAKNKINEYLQKMINYDYGTANASLVKELLSE